ncbi:MAG: hypothetical protein JO142_02170 [Burkholderiales bacterium]|nr:hypothetical protein [Burkholderiales bacterium]
MANGRCRMHGGKATGPKDRKRASEVKKGNRHAATPGSPQSKFFTEEELQEAMANGYQVGSVDPELLVLKIKLTRLLKQEADHPEGIETLVEKIVREGGGALAPVEKKYQRRDTYGEILRTIALIEKLTRTRAEILAAEQSRQDDGPVTEIRIVTVAASD